MDEWYKQVIHGFVAVCNEYCRYLLPPVTRVYVTLCFITTAACALEIITPFHIYFNFYFIFHKYEFWRLLTNFLFFGNLGLDFVFHMFFLLKYCKMLEEGSFRMRSADFLWMLLLGAGLLTLVAPFVDVRFLGTSLTFMMVYVWGRRNPYVTLSFLGIFNFTAPYLPWVLLGFSVVLRSSPVVDLLGMAVGERKLFTKNASTNGSVGIRHCLIYTASGLHFIMEKRSRGRGSLLRLAGHIYYFLEDVYPRMSGRRLLKTPGIVKALFGSEEEIRILQNPQPTPQAANFGAQQPAAADRGFPAPGVVPPPGQ